MGLRGLGLLGFLAVAVASCTNVVAPTATSAPTSTPVPQEWQEVARWGFGSKGVEFSGPSGIAIDASDQVYISETNTNRVRKFTPEGDVLAEWGGFGVGPGQLQAPMGVDVGPDGNVYVSEGSGKRVQIFSPDGAVLHELSGPGGSVGEFSSPQMAAVDDDLRVYVSDWGSGRIQVYDDAGEYLFQIEAPGMVQSPPGPSGMEFGPDGDLWVTDRGNFRVQRFRRDGELVQEWTRSGRGIFKAPTDIAFDADGNWWVAELTGPRVRQFLPGGELLFELFPDSFVEPRGLAFDGTGALYVVDAGFGVVRKFRLTD